jgi:apolipoprotein N-acyltransferase
MTSARQLDRPHAMESSQAKATASQHMRPRPKLVLLAVASGFMLWASFYPLNLGWLGWVALVPLLGLVRAQASAWRVYGAALLCGLVFFIPVLQWMRVADPMMYATWIALALYCALYFPAAIYLLRRLARRVPLPLVVTLPVVWTALEFLRAHLISGFPWYYLAHTQHEFPAIIQISDVTGAYGVSALVAAVNALAFELLWRAPWFRNLCEPGPWVQAGRSRIGLQIVGVGGLFGALLVYGLVRLNDGKFEKGPLVLLVQPSVPQQIRNEAFQNANQGNPVQTLTQQYRDLTQTGLNSTGKPALVVWPESSLPVLWEELSPEFIKEYPWAQAVAEASHAEARRLARIWHADFLVGGTVGEIKGPETELRYNSAIFIHWNGQVTDRYNKIHRVPFGEYVPLVEMFPFMKVFSPYDFDYSVRAGTTFNRFSLEDGYTFGVLICYEDSDPTLARHYARAGTDGGPVNFLVNISNDGWFDGTSEHDQHLATCRFRAIEARRAVARSVNMGVSAVIDGNGQIVALPGSSIAGSKKMEGTVACNIPIDSRTSYYAALGDWLPWTCWVLIAGGVLYGWFRGPTSSSLSSTSSGGALASP